VNKNKDSFWKVLACVFLIWAFIFLWSNSIKIWIDGRLITKVNKLTGNSIIKVLQSGEWEKYSKSNFMSIFDIILNYIILIIFFGCFIVLIAYTIKAIRNPSKKGG